MDGSRQAAQDEALLRVVLDSVQEAIIIRAPDGRVLDCNALAERIFGLTRGQILSQESPPGYRATTEDGAPVTLENTPGAQTIRTGAPSKRVPLSLHLPDGTLRWIEVTTTPLPGGAKEPPFGVVICVADVTESRTARELALVAERRIEAMLEHSEGGVFEVDFEHGYVARSQHIYRMLGYLPGEIGTTMPHWREHVHDDDRPRVAAAWDAIEQGASDRVDCTYRMRHKEGHWVWIQVRARVTRRGLSGKHQRASGTVLNVTERLRLEDELRVANETIARLQGKR